MSDVQLVRYTGPTLGGDGLWQEALPERATHVVMERPQYERLQAAADKPLDHQRTMSCGHTWTLRCTACPQCFAELRAVVRRIAALADVTSILELSGEWVALIQQAREALGAEPVDGEIVARGVRADQELTAWAERQSAGGEKEEGCPRCGPDRQLPLTPEEIGSSECDRCGHALDGEKEKGA